jgi:CheY-like chemotaxis protein
MTARPHPPSRVLLVDEDIEELASLAAILRQRGLSVALANGTAMACERAKLGRFDVIVAGAELSDPSADALSLADALAVELGRSPPILLMEREGAGAADGDVTLHGSPRVARGDVDALVTRIHAMAAASGPRSEGSLAPAPLTHGMLTSIGLADVLQTLSLEKKTGALVLTTAAGAGDLRMLDGAVVDVVYQCFEGPKALARMLAETDGRFSFTADTPPVMRRMHLATPELLRSARAQLDETRRLRAELADLAKKALLASEPADQADAVHARDLSPTARNLLARLRAPQTIDELLDDSPEPDAALLSAIRELDQAGRLRRLAHETHRVPLVPTDQLHLIRALVSRATAPGFSGAARLVFAGTPARLSVFAHAAIWLADAIAASEPAPGVPIPYAVATVRLGDDIELELVALPLVPAYAPLWPMTLAGAAIVVRLDDAAGSTLAEACAAADLPILDAQTLVGALEEASVTQVASLVRAAVEATHV